MLYWNNMADNDSWKIQRSKFEQLYLLKQQFDASGKQIIV